jgi:hypothetical protein
VGAAGQLAAGLVVPARRRPFVALMWGDLLLRAMTGAHCATCEAYEERVMAKAHDEGLPPDVVPCPSFVMSDRFREWAVAEMRKEVLGQVKAAGLDRMAVVKAGKSRGGALRGDDLRADGVEADEPGHP